MDPINHLEATTLDIIQNGKTATDNDFQAVAWRTFLYQYQNNTPYRNYCDALGKTPETISLWQEIPAVPTDAFKLRDSPLVTFPIEKIAHTFLTSGTTKDIRGAHHFPSNRLYEASILQGWNALNTAPVENLILLTPHPEQAPQSSLSHMMGVLEAKIGNQQHWVLTESGDFDAHSILRAISDNKPVAILGTALSFLHWFETLPNIPPLPDSSWAFETGGYKGTGRTMEKADLYSLFEQHLALKPEFIINEYSMTELSSQFYTRGLTQPHQAPPWTRIRVIDPATGRDCQAGTPGYLCIYDLANLHSVMAIQTQDIAIAHNHQSFTLLGRDPSALPRGCSRAADATHPPVS